MSHKPDGSTTNAADSADLMIEDLGALTRRRFIRGAVATTPVLATLPSGAALARSSNIVTKASGGVDRSGRTLCLDARSGRGLMSGGTAIDLGQPPHGRVSAIRERDYRVGDHSTAAEVSESKMCRNGGYYYYKTSWGWKKVSVPKGLTMSAMALSSFAGTISITEI